MEKRFREQIVLAEDISIEGVIVMQLTASIESDKPTNNLSYSPIIINQELYMEHREDMKQAMSEFEQKVIEKKGNMSYGNEI